MPPYGHAHRNYRARLAPAVEAGVVRCARCGELIEPGDFWDLDHGPDRMSYLGPSHRRCNRGAPSKQRKAARMRWSRQW